MVDLTGNAAQPSGEVRIDPAHPCDARATLFQALLEAGLDPLLGEGVEYALCGVSADRDATALAAAVAETERSLGQQQCGEATSAARRALKIVAARQASGMAVPELPRIWGYLLLCADRVGDIDGAMRAAQWLRATATGAVSQIIPPELLEEYPAVDALLGVDRFDVDIATDDGAVVWLDFQPVGTAPIRLALPAGEHIVAAAKGSRRGSAVFTSAAAKTVAIALEEQRGRWTAVATKIASLRGAIATAHDLDWILDQVDARVALVRRGDIVQAWGRAGAFEQPRQLGGQAGVRPTAQADQVARVLAREVRKFTARTPDPDRPLLVGDTRRPRRTKGGDDSTAWWVYAAIGASIAAGALVIYLYRPESSSPPLEMRRP